MEIKVSNKTYNPVLIAIALGIWVLVLQNAGIIDRNKEVEVSNKVAIQGDVDVQGPVDANIGSTVDVNIQAINGNSNAFYDHAGDRNYERIPVYTGN
ncbi:MAG: hypothetical protein RJA76_53 [Bacteroidota bacterium]|jgi:hypothetical protein